MSRYYVRNGMHYGTADEMIDLIEELEAKLAKAVEALGGVMMHMPDYADTVWIDARATLAELTGGEDGNSTERR